MTIEEDTEPPVVILPAAPGAKALVFWWFDDQEAPHHEVIEHPIIAWEVRQSYRANERRVALPVLTDEISDDWVIGVLFDDGRVGVIGDRVFDDRCAFEREFVWQNEQRLKSEREEKAEAQS